MTLGIFHRFEFIANTNPEEPAITSAGRTVSYKDLLSATDEMADGLQNILVSSDTAVAVCLNASIDYVVTLLALYKLGKAVIPLGDGLPRQRMKVAFEHTGARVVITKPGLKLPEGTITYSETTLTGESATKYSLSVHTLAGNRILQKDFPKNIAYILTTSGTSGTPKFILGSSKGLLHFIEWERDFVKSGKGFSSAFLSAVTFDVSLRDIFLPLLAGGHLHIPAAETLRQPGELVSWLATERVNLVHIVPTLFREVTAQLHRQHSQLPELSWAILAGEPLYFTDIESWREIAGNHCKLVNMYGPSETTLAKLFFTVPESFDEKLTTVPLGKPLPNTYLYVIGENNEVCESGEVGELCISTAYQSFGYLNVSAEKEKAFCKLKVGGENVNIYRTGDLVHQDNSGVIHFHERVDFQVKFNGQRIELVEIEGCLRRYKNITQAVVQLHVTEKNIQQLIAYITVESETTTAVDELRTFLSSILPGYMVPSRYVVLREMPTNANGKIDRKSLPELTSDRPEQANAFVSASGQKESLLVDIWKELLGIDDIGVTDNFFNLGGTSLLIMRMLPEIEANLGGRVTIADVIDLGTIRKIVNHLECTTSDRPLSTKSSTHKKTGASTKKNTNNTDVAIIGMACRVPGSENVEQFWSSLLEGKEQITFFTDDQLHPCIDRATYQDVNYVKARGIVNDAESFDTHFFSMPRKDVEIMDPQQRILIELGMVAIEDAALELSDYQGSIGVFAGVGNNEYYTNNLHGSKIAGILGEHRISLSNEKDYVAPRISYALDLSGPAISVHTACSTSLVAIAQGVQSLRDGSSDAVLCGGAYVQSPQYSGYPYVENGFASRDGHCYPFDARGSGTVFSSGAGMVLLKRFDDALDAGDNIYAVIKGVGVSNDGGGKMSFMAPSSKGQTRAIQAAIADSGVDIDSVSYIETHGTATQLGDPIEIDGLAQVFNRSKDHKLLLGAVKGGLGHLDAAAGVIGLIKSSLALHHKMIPATVNYEKPNKNIDFENLGFEVVNKCIRWPINTVGRAGVSSFGVGGTNAHVVIEEAPSRQPSSVCERHQLLVLNGKTASAAIDAASKLADYLESHTDINLADVAYTLQVGRAKYEFGVSLACSDLQNAITDLRALASKKKALSRLVKPKVVFMFPGQGAQHLEMGKELYEQETIYRQCFDRCCDILITLLNVDLRALIFPTDADDKDELARRLTQTHIAQPALFVIEYSMAQLLLSWGVSPVAMIGHSVGEYIAATLSGVFDVGDALELLTMRGHLMGSMPSGDMVAVRIGKDQVEPFLPGGVSIAANNAPGITVVTGPADRVETFCQQMQSQDIEPVKLHTSHAFHSAMMDPILEPFANSVAKVTLGKPHIPFISCLTGTWINDEQAQSSEYWAQQLRNTVRFSDGINELLDMDEVIFLEVGPGSTLTSSVKQHRQDNKLPNAISSLGPVQNRENASIALLTALGGLWQFGVIPKWGGLYANESRHRLHLPAYPFERVRCWIDEHTSNQTNTAAISVNSVRPEKAGSVELQLAQLFEKSTGTIISEAEFPDTFLELGFDSLLMTQISARLQKQLDIKMPLSELMEKYNSMSKLANHIRSIRSEESGHTENSASGISNYIQPDELPPESKTHSLLSKFTKDHEIGLMLAKNPPIVGARLGRDEHDKPHWYVVNNKHPNTFNRVKVKADYLEFIDVDYDPFAAPDLEAVMPMSVQQREVFISSIKSPDASRAFNLSRAFYISGDLDVPLLSSSVQRCIERHQTMRASFHAESLSMCVLKENILDIPVYDNSLLTGLDKEQELTRLLELESMQPFELTKGVPVRAKIIKVSTVDYILVFIAHHIITDGWSLGVLEQELGEIYSAAVDQRLVNLETPTLFSEYYFEEIEYRNSKNYTNTENYWFEQYTDDSPVLELPNVETRPPERTFASSRSTYSINEQLVQKLLIFSTESNSSLFQITYAAYLVFLHRITSQSDIVIGVPAAGQKIVDGGPLMGHCVNMLPVRNRLLSTMSFTELVAMVKKTLFSAMDYSQYTFSELLGKVNLPVDRSRIPLVSTTFNIDGDRKALNFSGLTGFSKPIARKFETFELAVHLTRHDNIIDMDFDYNTQLFDRASIEKMQQQFVKLLLSVMDKPQQKLFEIPLLSESDKAILAKVNKTDRQYPNDQCIHQLITKVVSTQEYKTAVIFEDQQYSYQDLESRSNKLAHFLIEKGVHSGVLVGLCMHRSADMLVALLGILKAGGGYLPLDPEYPGERIEYIIENANAPLLITQESLLDSMPGSSGHCICLDSDWPLIESESDSTASVDITPADCAYVIYTSGSTGKPKGVQVSHGNVVNFLCSMQEEPGLCSTDKLLAVTTLSFDIAVLELYLPLISGACVEIASRSIALDASALIRKIERSGITAMQATPATWRILLQAGWKGNTSLKALVGGEALPADLLPGLLSNTSELWNMYGPTETTVWSTCCRVLDANAAISIGKPIANTQIYILDEFGQQVPPGARGELYIGGSGVTQGYLNRPDLTRERYIDNQFSHIENGRLYRTGDQVKLMPDGNLQYISRLDGQVKVRGYRIELGEIESVLCSHSGVKQSVVIVREDQPADIRLAVYYVANDKNLPKQSIRGYLQGLLPSYMVPQYFVELDELPQTPNGKIDRKKLPVPESGLHLISSDIVPARNDFEVSLLAIWKRLLAHPTMGITDDFFESGGHSLLAITAVNEMESATGVKFDIGLLFQYSTIERLVEALGSNAAQSSSNVVHLNDTVQSTDEAKEPLFLLCGVDIYRELADVIEDREVYGVYVFSELAIVKNAMQGQVGDVSFDLLCSNYVDAIRRIKPKGPYQLGGISFGGFIALEVARKLQGLGEEIKEVLLLDTMLPSAYKRNFARYLLKGVLPSPGKAIAQLGRRVRRMISKNERANHQHLVNENEKAIMLRERVFANIMRENENSLKTYHGKVILCKAQDRVLAPWVEEEKTLGWSRIVPESLTVVEVVGDHLGIVRGQNASFVANVINKLR